MQPRAPFALAVFVASLSIAAPPVSAANDPIGGVAQRFIEESALRDPLFADSIGIHRYDDRLDDYSMAGVAHRTAWLRVWQHRLNTIIARGSTDPAAAADASELRDTIALELFENETVKPRVTDPTFYTSVIGNAIYQLTGRSYAPAAERLRHVASRLALLPDVVAATMANVRHPARVMTLQAIDANAGNIQTVTDLPHTAAIDRNRARALHALRRLQRFLGGPLLARSDGGTRVGAAVYDRELQLQNGTNATRADLVRRARADFERTRAKMLELALPLDREFFPADRAAESQPNATDVVVRRVLDKLASDHPARDAIFASAKADVRAAETFLAAHPVVVLPHPKTLKVAPTPAFLAGFSGASFDGPGPFTPLAEGYYYIDEIPKTWSAQRVESYLRDYNTFELKMLSLHEAMPGHYVQLRYNNATPRLIPRVFGNGSYIEGWAVYVEGMMLDAGYGAGDPKLRLFQLKWRLREQANTLIDAGYHAQNMTKTQLEDLLVREAYQERAQVETKWHRLQLSHDQLSSYYVGLDAITRARDAAKAKLGERFDVAAFNTALLEIGAVEPRFIAPLVLAKLGAG